VRRSWPILATLIAAVAVSIGSAGLRALHVVTAPEHVGHRAAHAHDARTSSACGHSHGHSCARDSGPLGAADRELQLAADQSQGANDPHEADCATCDLLVTLSTDVALPAPALAPCGAAGDAPRDAALQPAVRTLASVRARPPPAA